ncbi:MAG: hypothetical protein ABID84_01600 [Chloroflexota bacterium]
MTMFALSAIKWTQLITTSLQVANSARQWYETLSKKRAQKGSVPPIKESATLASLSTAVQQAITRLEETESDVAEQAQIVSQMATQEEALSRGLQAVSARLTVLLWVSASALLVGLIAIVIAFLK